MKSWIGNVIPACLHYVATTIVWCWSQCGSRYTIQFLLLLPDFASKNLLSVLELMWKSIDIHFLLYTLSLSSYFLLTSLGSQYLVLMCVFLAVLKVMVHWEDIFSQLEILCVWVNLALNDNSFSLVIAACCSASALSRPYIISQI